MIHWINWKLQRTSRYVWKAFPTFVRFASNQQTVKLIYWGKPLYFFNCSWMLSRLLVVNKVNIFMQSCCFIELLPPLHRKRKIKNKILVYYYVLCRKKWNLLNKTLLKWFMFHIISFYGCYTDNPSSSLSWISHTFSVRRCWLLPIKLPSCQQTFMPASNTRDHNVWWFVSLLYKPENNINWIQN